MCPVYHAEAAAIVQKVINDWMQFKVCIKARISFRVLKKGLIQSHVWWLSENSKVERERIIPLIDQSVNLQYIMSWVLRGI